MKFKTLISNFAALLLLCACSDEIPYSPEMPQDNPHAASIPFEVQGDVPESRGVPALAHEKKLERAHILFFDDATGEFAGFAAVNISAGKRVISLTKPDGTEFDRPYRVLAVGNGDTFTPEGYSSFSAYLDKFSGDYASAKATLTAAYGTKMTVSSPGTLPMFGTFISPDGEDSAITFYQDGENQKVREDDASFYFARAAVRIDLLNLVGGLLLIEKVKVVNERTAGLFFADGVNVGSQPEFKPSEEGYVAVTDAENTTQRLTGALYTFPNMVNTSVQNDRTTTALMIAGYYFDDTTGQYDSELTYYRFNLANVGESQILQRNYMYRASIKGVRRRGASDEQTAYNDSAPIFSYDIDEDWESTGDNVTTDEDGNFLIVSKSHLTFDGEANSADFVELRVSTNPELEWHAEWVAEPGNSNERFTFEKLSSEAVKCGPTEINDSPYVLYGYLRIVAVNPNSGKTLSLPIYLNQLSTLNNVKTLTVNGSTGVIELPLDPMGANVLLKVVTGSKMNQWQAVDDGTFTGWDTQGISFTKSGGNNTYLELVFPANITGKARVAEITVSLVDDPEGKVLPVTLKLSQDPSSQLMSIVNFPESGVLSIECLSLDAGNYNGVVNPRNFIVRLTDARYRYRVTTDFDRYRDLVLSATNHKGVGSTAPATATQPTDGGVYKDDILEGMENNSQFWINPFRTGPGDPTITGTVTVEAYLPGDDTAHTEKRSFTVRLTTAEVEISDVFVSNGDNYVMLPDRNLGTPARVQFGTDEPLTAVYSDTRQNVKVTNQNPDPYLRNFFGTIITSKMYFLHDSNFNYSFSPTKAVALAQFLEDNSKVNFLYADNTGWSFPTKAQVDLLSANARWSKQRVFIVSDIPARRNGKEIPIACWMHYLSTTNSLGGTYSLYIVNENPYARGYTTYAMPAWCASYASAGVNGVKYLDNNGQTPGITSASNLTQTTGARPARNVSAEEMERVKTELLGY